MNTQLEVTDNELFIIKTCLGFVAGFLDINYEVLGNYLRDKDIEHIVNVHSIEGLIEKIGD